MACWAHRVTIAVIQVGAIAAAEHALWNLGRKSNRERKGRNNSSSTGSNNRLQRCATLMVSSGLQQHYLHTAALYLGGGTKVESGGGGKAEFGGGGKKTSGGGGEAGLHGRRCKHVVGDT